MQIKLQSTSWQGTESLDKNPVPLHGHSLPVPSARVPRTLRNPEVLAPPFLRARRAPAWRELVATDRFKVPGRKSPRVLKHGRQGMEEDDLSDLTEKELKVPRAPLVFPCVARPVSCGLCNLRR
jgi:hypothetical protein